jgi:hypothetical protein
MRIALHSSGDIGARAGRMLLAERSLTALGLYGHQGQVAADRKVMAIREPTGFEVLATDDPEIASGLAGIAVDDGLSCVVTASTVDDGLDARFRDAGVTLLVGADLAHGLAAALAAHELARPEHVGSTTVAWTVPGKPRRRGIAVPFPEPVGPRWGRAAPPATSRTGVRGVEVPIGGEWAAATVTVTGSDDGARVQRVIGLADHADHVAAIALAAGIIAVAEGGYEPGLRRPDDDAEAYLAAALRIGLAVAAFNS